MERMVNEYRELCERVEKLEKFINENPLFDKLDKKEKYLQTQQLIGMRIYLMALMDRLYNLDINIGKL